MPTRPRHPSSLLPRSFLPLALPLALAACEPDIDDDVIDTETMIFDPAAAPPRVPDPSFLVIDRSTGRINLALAGTPVPPDCTVLPEAFKAPCEFGQYLQSLDGFPTVTPARAPASAALDAKTLTAANVVVMNGATALGDADRTIAFDTAANNVIVAAKPAWPVGAQLRLGVRGYGSGVKTTTGREVIASPVFDLLRREAPGETAAAPTWLLTCGGTPTVMVPDTCGYLSLVAGGAPVTEATKMSLIRLEQTRQAYLQTQTWSALAAGGLPKAETAVAWGFPVHSASVIELDPTPGSPLQPQVVSTKELRLRVNGSVNPTTVKPSALGTPGTVALLDLTALQAGALAVPAIQATYEAGAIVIRPAVDLAPGHTYAIAVSRKVTNTAGAGLVPPPVSVFLMATGPLAVGGKSTISTLADANAAALEPNRRMLAPAFPAIQEIAGMSRADLAYFFAISL